MVWWVKSERRKITGNLAALLVVWVRSYGRAQGLRCFQRRGPLIVYAYVFEQLLSVRKIGLRSAKSFS
jgi:hypothetical protein